MSKTLGIIGGLGPAASNYFADLLTKITDANCDQQHLKVLHFNNPAVPDRTAYILGKGDDPVPELLNTVQSLERAGVSHLCMPCNTAHAPQILDRLRPYMNTEFIDLIDVTMEATATAVRSGATVTVLGTEGTALAGTYARACEARGFRHRPLSPAAQNEVSSIIYKIKAKGASASDAEKLANVMRATTADVFILGCTELSLLYEYLVDNDSSLPFIDSLRALAHHTIREFKLTNQPGENHDRLPTRSA